jgi:hypothetical protein
MVVFSGSSRHLNNANNSYLRDEPLKPPTGMIEPVPPLIEQEIWQGPTFGTSIIRQAVSGPRYGLVNLSHLSATPLAAKQDPAICRGEVGVD